MKRLVQLSLLALVGTSAFGALAASAFHLEKHGAHAIELAPLMSVLEPEQRRQLHALFMSDRAHLDLLHEQLRQARWALITKLLSPEKTIDPTPEVTKLKEAQAALVDARVRFALEARKIMSTQQLARASELWARWRSLREQERALFEQVETSGAAQHGQGESSKAVSPVK